PTVAVLSDFFFFQAEDGIRDGHVTGVQTCALPIYVDAGGQAELVRAISDARPDRSATHAGTRLFDFLKEETIRAFYTSRMGLKELDDHGNSFYGQPPGCGLPLRLRPTRSEPE